jgi:hypothetical protein
MTVRTLTVALALLTLAALLAPTPLPAADAKSDAKTNLLKPTNKLDTWRLEQHMEGKATMTVDGDAIAFDVTATGTEPWHVQATHTGLDLMDGKEYVLTFKAKASSDRSVQVNAMIDQDDWHNIGLSELADFAKEWKDYKYEFKADQTVKAGKNRVSFVLGGDKGKVWLKDVTLTAK